MEVADESNQPYYIDSYVHNKNILHYVLKEKMYICKKYLYIYKNTKVTQAQRLVKQTVTVTQTEKHYFPFIFWLGLYVWVSKPQRHG